MFEVDRFGRTPIYEQIMDQAEKLIALGILGGGDQLPSVRALSEQLNVNPNTLQKAYAELERRGICQSVPGSGRYVSTEARERIRSNANEHLREIERLARRVADAGISRQEAVGAVERAYERSEQQG